MLKLMLMLTLSLACCKQEAPTKSAAAVTFAVWVNPDGHQNMIWVDPGYKVNASKFEADTITYTTVPMVPGDKPRTIEVRVTPAHSVLLVEQAAR